MEQSITYDKAKSFAIRIIRLYKELTTRRNEGIMAKQILRCGTSIGANLAEALYGSSKRDFINKCRIAEKEAGETKFWLEILHPTEYISEREYHSLISDINELLCLLAASIKTAEKNLKMGKK